MATTHRARANKSTEQGRSAAHPNKAGRVVPRTPKGATAPALRMIKRPSQAHGGSITIGKSHSSNSPTTFAALDRQVPARALSSAAECERMIGMIDRLMSQPRLTGDQRIYLETLVQLVSAYEARAVPMEPAGGLEVLKHLMEAHQWSATDLARNLGIHPSMGSKILLGERSLTLDHVRTLASKFGVGPEVFVA